MHRADRIEELGNQIVLATIDLSMLCKRNTPELDRACNQINAAIRSLNKAIERERKAQQ